MDFLFFFFLRLAGDFPPESRPFLSSQAFVWRALIHVFLEEKQMASLPEAVNGLKLGEASLWLIHWCILSLCWVIFRRWSKAWWILMLGSVRFCSVLSHFEFFCSTYLSLFPSLVLWQSLFPVMFFLRPATKRTERVNVKRSRAKG